MLTRAAVLAGRVPGGPLRQLGRGLRRMTVSASQSGVPEPPTVDWSREGANSVSLIGTVGKDPMPRVLPSGKKVCSIRIAVNQPGKTERPADWCDDSDEEHVFHARGGLHHGGISCQRWLWNFRPTGRDDEPRSPQVAS